MGNGAMITKNVSSISLVSWTFSAFCNVGLIVVVEFRYKSCVINIIITIIIIVVTVVFSSQIVVVLLFLQQPVQSILCDQFSQLLGWLPVSPVVGMATS